MIAIIYVPLCVVFIILRAQIHRMEDQPEAPQRLDWLWLSLVLAGTGAQRACYSYGLHPTLTVDEAGLAFMYQSHCAPPPARRPPVAPRPRRGASALAAQGAW